jgi:serine/threonine-protein kinase
MTVRGVALAERLVLARKLRHHSCSGAMDLPSPGAVVAGKYRLEALLGVGGMGAVYRARHLLMDNTVALKWLRPDLAQNREARERLLREAQSVARIRHPNVVQVFDVDTHDGMPFMVMEHLEGETFGDLLEQNQLTTKRVIELLIGALHGLSAAHELGIVHRDVKPENIFIMKTRQHPDGIAKLLDFGVSKIDKLDPHSARLTQTGSAVGTPLYMSIEQLTQTSDVDRRADIYAFGVVLYHALSGVLPFDGETFAGVVLSIGTTQPRSLKQLRPELPSSLDRVVMKAMARRREDRYPTAPALIEALRGVVDSLSQPVPAVAYANTLTPNLEEDDSLDALRREGTRKKRGLGIAALLLAAVALGAAWRARERPTVHANPAAVAAPAPLPEVTRLVPVPVPVPAPALAPPPEPAPRAKPAARRSERRRKVEIAKPVIEPPNKPLGKSGGLLREDF